MISRKFFSLIRSTPLMVTAAMVIAVVVIPAFDSQIARATTNPVMVKDIDEGSGSGYPDYLTVVGSTLYFSADDGANGTELWKSDGTSAGTVIVKDIRISGGSFPSELTVVGSTLYFSASDGANGTELWKSDGTAEGTVMVKDINATVSGSSYPSNLTVVGSTLYFSASDGTNGTELWKSDGTDAGTVMVKDIRTGSNNSSPSNLTVVGSTLYFSAFDGTNGTELWKSDGTDAGTVMVKDIRTGLNLSSTPLNLTAVGSTLYFAASDGNFSSPQTNNYELWKSDGTDAGTVIVKDIRISGGSFPSELTVVGSTMYFFADDGTNGIELWIYDTTSAVGDLNPKMVKNINTDSDGEEPEYLTVVGSMLYFAFDNDGTDNFELWTSDGTADGTVMVKDINTVEGSYPYGLTVIGSTLYFNADDGTNGAELWKLDTTLPVMPTTTTVAPTTTTVAPTTTTVAPTPAAITPATTTVAPTTTTVAPTTTTVAPTTTSIPASTTTPTIAKPASIPRSQVPGVGRAVPITRSAPPRVASAVGIRVSSSSISLALARPAITRSMQPASYSVALTRIGWGVVSRRSLSPASAKNLASLSFNKLSSARYEVIVMAKNAEGKTIGRWKSQQIRVGNVSTQN